MTIATIEMGRDDPRRQFVRHDAAAQPALVTRQQERDDRWARGCAGRGGDDATPRWWRQRSVKPTVTPSRRFRYSVHISVGLNSAGSNCGGRAVDRRGRNPRSEAARPIRAPQAGAGRAHQAAHENEAVGEGGGPQRKAHERRACPGGSHLLIIRHSRDAGVRRTWASMFHGAVVKQTVQWFQSNPHMPGLNTVRHAVRTLAHSPLFTITSIASLALGIAASSAIFSIADALFLRPRAGLVDESRLVDIGRTTDGQGFDNFGYQALLVLREATAPGGDCRLPVRPDRGEPRQRARRIRARVCGASSPPTTSTCSAPGRRPDGSSGRTKTRCQTRSRSSCSSTRSGRAASLPRRTSSVRRFG